MEVWLDLLRNKSGGDRLKLAFDISCLAFAMSEMGVRSRHPGAGERELFLRAASLRLPRDLMIRAYGWDPQQDEEPGGRV
jgi:hypothetical protein